MVGPLSLRTAWLALTLLSTWIGGAIAQPAPLRQLTEPLREGGKATYADLVRLIVPGVVVNGERYRGGQAIDVRGIYRDMDGAKPESTEHLRVAAVPVRSSGRDRTVLLLDFGRGLFDVGFAILALFDAAGKPRLLDAANVATGTSTFFLDPARLSVEAGNDVLMIQSSHFNSSQHYVNTVLVLARDDRLELVDAISTYNERSCAYELTQQLGIQQRSGKPFADIAATVTERTIPSGERCGDAAEPEARTRAISVIYRWDVAAQRYLPDSDAFDVLARENEKRF